MQPQTTQDPRPQKGIQVSTSYQQPPVQQEPVRRRARRPLVIASIAAVCIGTGGAILAVSSLTTHAPESMSVTQAGTGVTMEKGMYHIDGTITNNTTTIMDTPTTEVVHGSMERQPAAVLNPGQCTTFSSYSDDPTDGDDTVVGYLLEGTGSGVNFEAQNLPTGHNTSGTHSAALYYTASGTITSGLHDTATFSATGDGSPSSAAAALTVTSGGQCPPSGH